MTNTPPPPGMPPKPGWWVASDGNWYPPEQHPDYIEAPPPMPPPSYGPPPGAPAPDGGNSGAGNNRLLIILALVVAAALGLGVVLTGGDDNAADGARLHSERETVAQEDEPSFDPAGEAIAQEWADEFMRDNEVDRSPVTRDEMLCFARTLVEALGNEQATTFLRDDQQHLGSSDYDLPPMSDENARRAAEAARCIDDFKNVIASSVRNEGTAITTEQLDCYAGRAADDMEHLLYLQYAHLVLEFEREIEAITEYCGIDV